jgi:periplasmic protein TonB
MYASPGRSTLISGLLHAGAIVLVLAATRVRPATPVPSHVVIYEPPPWADFPASARPHAGGGGGVRSESPASRGALPPVARRQFAPPVVRVENFDPVLPMAPTIVSDSPLAPLNAALFGDPHGVSGPPSGGTGSGGGTGDGEGTGVGPGRGPGAGPGYGGGVSGRAGSFPVRGVVTEPVLLWKIEPDYTEEARKARLQGVVVLRVEVDELGRPRNITVGQGLGLGLDERAMEAVRQWKFKPGYAQGRPVVTRAVIEVNFRLL